MSLLSQLSSLALDGLSEARDFVSGAQIGAGAAAVTKLVLQRFVDHSARLPRALGRSNARAWRAVEIALAGQSWWDRCKLVLATADEKAIREQVQAYLRAHPLDGLDGHGPDFRAQCLAQLHAVRKAGLLDGGAVDPEEVARRVGDLSRFGDPSARVQAEQRSVEEIADRLRHQGCAALATFLTLRPAGGPPLLLAAVRFFFRREVERDPELFRGLAHARMEDLAAGQSSGFAELADALDSHGERLEALLSEVQAVVLQTHADVLDVKAELTRQGQQMQELGRAVLQALEGRQLARRELSPGDSLSVRDENERRLVRDLVRRYRSLPAEERKRMPALLNAVGKLEVVAGDFEAAQRDFREVATLVPDRAARAEAAFNAYRVALERRAWDEALASLRDAQQAQPERFALFPSEKFEAERILGAGGFGVAVLCRNRHSGGRVVIKALRRDGLDRDLNEVFREAQALEELEHPAIIRIRDCDYADREHTRAFLVMDYFDGATLAEQVERGGPLTVGDLLPLARLVAEGLGVAHGKGILHRDVKPGNLLVRREAGRWQAKLIDFGLALRARAASSTFRSSADRTLAGSSIAGTIEYAAPEQIGRLKGASVGPYSDVYGFGKLCCFALFGTPQPTFQHWKRLPPELADLLGRCLDEQPRNRPQGFPDVLRELDRLLSPAARPAQPGAAPAPRPVADVIPVVEALPVERVLTVEAAPVARVREVPIGPEPPRSRAREVHAEALPAARPARAAPGRPAERRPLGFVGGWLVLLVLATLTAAGMGGLYWLLGRSRPSGPGGPPRPWATSPTRLAGGGTQSLNRPRPGETTNNAEPITEKELPAVLTELDGKPTAARLRELAARFARTEPTAEQRRKHAALRALKVSAKAQEEERRADTIWRVSRGLNPLLDQNDAASKKAAAEALQKWGTPDNVPGLILAVDAGEFGVWNMRIEVARALAKIGDERGLRPVAKRLEDLWDRSRGIVEALCDFPDKGAVENVMIEYVQAATRPGATSLQVDAGESACRVLEKVGTWKSLATLTVAAGGKGGLNLRLRNAASAAIKGIGARPKP